MTAEQLNELADALLVLSAKSSVLKERDELRALMEENLQVEEVSSSRAFLVGQNYNCVLRILLHHLARSRNGFVQC
jgi:LETM1 and EF-hand domain-containing protein 1, mitochondrial